MRSGKQKGRWGELFVQVFHSLFNHPKTLDFTSRLGNPPLAWAHLVLIWAWAQRCATAGRFRVDATQISKIAEWTGDPSVFLAALLDSGFFEKSGEKFRIHDWEQHSGAINIKRRKDIERHRIQGTSVEVPREDVDVDVDVDVDGKTEQITDTDLPPSAPPGKPAGAIQQELLPVQDEPKESKAEPEKLNGGGWPAGVVRIFEEMTGGVLPGGVKAIGRVGRALKRTVDLHGWPEVEQRLRWHLRAAVAGKWARRWKPEDFAQGYGQIPDPNAPPAGTEWYDPKKHGVYGDPKP